MELYHDIDTIIHPHLHRPHHLQRTPQNRMILVPHHRPIRYHIPHPLLLIQPKRKMEMVNNRYFRSTST